MKTKKLKILTNVLGTPYRSNNEFLFKCPYCDHHKRKFSVNVAKGYYKCWVCDTRGKNIYRVIRRFGNNHDKAQWREFTDIVDYDKLEDLFAEKIEEKQILEMPEGFVSLANKAMPPTGFAAMNYLRKRNITKQDIAWWKMGYCTEGEYAGRIIIPSFDEDGYVNYFVARTFKGSWRKYLNPPASKNIVFNELYLDFDKDLVIVEGIFDAMIAGPNSVPILGSTLRENSKLFQQIVKNDTPVYIGLDVDADRKSKKIIKDLLNYGIEVYKIDTSGFEDIGSMSKEEFLKRKNEAALYNSNDYLLYEAIGEIK